MICSYCEQDFVALSRHQWRCKKQMPSNHEPNETSNVAITVKQDPTNTIETVNYCCGKACKGTNGLKLHQRRCRDLEGLNDDPLIIDNSNSEIGSPLDNREIDSHLGMTLNQTDIAVTKPGIMLPKTNEHWNLAND